MAVRMSAPKMVCVGLLMLILSGCFRPPFNNFEDDNRTPRRVGISGGVGAGAGAVMGAVAGSTGVGAVAGAAVGAAYGLSQSTKQKILNELQRQDIQYVQYGDTVTLIIPTDRYYLFNSARLNDICYAGLNNIIRLLKYYGCTPIYVAGFTDDVGTRHHKNRLSQARAETMLTFLWAHRIHAQRLHAEGYGDKHDIGDNHLIHGSAYNRRIELQWLINPNQANARCG